MQVQIIVNPKAGRCKGVAAALEAQRELCGGGWEVEVVVTSAPGAATGLAALAAGRCDLVIACGGDGTLCEVLNGMQGSDTLRMPTASSVGFIPAGTGNDFARTVGLSVKPGEAARQLLQGGPQRVDLMRLGGPSLLAVNIIGIGFDAAVAARMNRQTRFGGGCLSYLAAVMIELARMRPVQLRLGVDGHSWEGEALLVAVANAQSYGGGMRIAPGASIDDGLLDVVVVEPLGRIEFLKTLPRVFKGTHLQHPAVSWRQAREVLVESEGPLPALVDGDIRAETPLRITVAPGAAKMWLPKARPSG